MSAADVIRQIQELPATEREKVVKFLTANSASLPHRTFTVITAADGLPLIRSNGGTITSELVREIESSSL